MEVSNLVERNLRMILSEVAAQVEVAASYPKDTLPFADEMNQIGEFIEAGEAGLAYECLVASLEKLPFALTGSAAVRLLEVGLLMGFKTQRSQDQVFNIAQQAVQLDGRAFGASAS